MRRWSIGVLLVAAPLAVAIPARSQLAASASLTNNYLYRGVSLSDGQPALDVALLYDNKSGFYLGGSLIGEVTRHSGAQPLGHQEYLGYAFRLPSRTSLDLGVNNLFYRSYVYPYGNEDATEVYAGWVASRLNVYIHYSPNYFQPRTRALYSEINGAVPLPRPWRLFAHGGVLAPFGEGSDGKAQYDANAGIGASFRHGEAQLEWSTERAQPYYPPPTYEWPYPPPTNAWSYPPLTNEWRTYPPPGRTDSRSAGSGVVVVALTFFF
jgi:uncharacterized protein (TIGR02001 family)